MSEFLEVIRVVIIPKDPEAPPELHAIRIRSSIATVPVHNTVISLVTLRPMKVVLSGRGHKTGHFFYSEI